ncbi:MAG TPA: hypothetical protein VNZ50_00220 [Hyphomicrobiaceae bacterium]|nr:hypothetical protein [Hyphomicrobiaceae bacterium]
MKNGHDDLHEQPSNVISLAGARKQAKAAAKIRKGSGLAERRTTAGQWLTSALLVALAIGGVFALAVPLLRAAGIVGG